MELFNYAKISKTAFRAITNINTEYIIKYTTEVHINKSNCGTCPLFCEYNKLKENLEFYRSNPVMYKEDIWDAQNKIESFKSNCSKTCDKACIKKEYHNDDNKYHLYNKKYRGKRVPKTSLKLFLLLHFIPNGGTKGKYIIKNINSKYLAEALNCNQKTIEKSLKILESLEYIVISNSTDNHHFNIIINSMTELYVTGDKGGSGYITLAKNTVKDLLNENNINVLRFSLLKLLKADDSTRIGEDNNTITWGLKDIKLRLPSHLRSKHQISHLMVPDDKLFDQTLVDSTFEFKLKELHLKDDSKNYVTENYDNIKELIWKYDIQENVSEGDLKDIANITLQYSTIRIEAAIQVLKQKLIENTLINTIGAYIRRICYNMVSITLA